MAVTGNDPVSAANVAAAIGAAPAPSATDGKPVSAANLKAMVGAQAAERSKTARLQDMTWAQLKEISDATNAGNLEQMKEKYKHLLWQRKDAKTNCMINNTGDWWHAVVLSDMGVDVDENGKPALFTFCCIEKFDDIRMNYGSVSTGWEGSEARNFLNTRYFNKFDADLKSAITPVVKKNSPGLGSDTIDSLWVPSLTEFGIDKTYDHYDEVPLGTPLSWFNRNTMRDCNSMRRFSATKGFMTRSMPYASSFFSVNQNIVYQTSNGDDGVVMMCFCV